MKPELLFKLALLPLLSCGVAAASEPLPPDPQRDRESILAMQGEYTVDFMFDETVLLAEGYERMEPQRSGGDEVVIVVDAIPATGMKARYVFPLAQLTERGEVTLDGTQVDGRQLTFNAIADANGVTTYEYTATTE